MTQTLLPDRPLVKGTPLIITPMSPESIGVELLAMNQMTAAAYSSAVWPAANRALYFPFTIVDTLVVDKVFVSNGATSNGNWDVGVYDSASTPNRLFSSGTTGQGTVSVLQEADITNYTLGPGNYYLAMASSSGSATFIRRVTAAALKLASCGTAQQATAFVLPSTATFATNATVYIPVFGISGRSLVA